MWTPVQVVTVGSVGLNAMEIPEVLKLEIRSIKLTIDRAPRPVWIAALSLLVTAAVAVASLVIRLLS